MKKLKSKGQGAMEYLMTYGWAILVVMIVGIAMWRLGIFNPSGTTSTVMVGFGSVKPQLSGTGYGYDGMFNGLFLNAGGAKIIVTGLTITDAKGNTLTCETGTGAADCCPDQSAQFDATGIHVAPNEHFKVTMDPASCSPPVVIDAGDAGEGYDLDVSVSYTVKIGSAPGTSHKSSGELRGPLE